MNNTFTLIIGLIAGVIITAEVHPIFFFVPIIMVWELLRERKRRSHDR